jgi:hypothetical protein
LAFVRADKQRDRVRWLLRLPHCAPPAIVRPVHARVLVVTVELEVCNHQQDF